LLQRHFIDRHRNRNVPLAPAPQEENSSSANAERPQRTVLYVEDHPVNVLLMQALFRKRPQHRLVVATTGEAGFRAAVAETPDLLLLDLRLPDCHGTELLQRLRAVQALGPVPVVAVTAEDTSDLAATGFVEIWHKPMDLHAALARLDRLLERPPGPAAPDATTVAAAPGGAWVAGRSRRPPPAAIPFPGAR
jgi:CheY-like chemotaxis protein